MSEGRASGGKIASGKIAALKSHLVIPMGPRPPAHSQPQLASPKEPAAVQMLDTSAHKNRPRRNSTTMRATLSAPSIELKEKPLSVVSPRSGTAPGQISMQELKDLAMAEKQKEKSRLASSPGAVSPRVDDVSPRPAIVSPRVAEGSAERKKRRKKKPSKSVGNDSVPAVVKAKEESDDQEEESSGSGNDDREKQAPPKIVVLSSPRELVSPRAVAPAIVSSASASASSSVASASPGEEPKKKQRRKKAKARPAGSSASSEALRRRVEELEREVERERARREATDQILSKLLASKSDEAVTLMMSKWQAAMDEVTRLNLELSGAAKGKMRES
jgi:hypothetical protein